MADNVNLTAGDGTIIAGADVIAGVAYPRAKVVWGPDNTVNDTDVASGKPLPVQLRSDVGTAVVVVEDAAAASDPVGPVLMAVRRDTLSTSEVSADGDNIALKASSKGKLHVAAETRFGDTVADLGSGTGGTATQRVIMDSSQLGALGQAVAASSAPVTMPSDRQNTVCKAISMTTDTSAYASADLIADTQQLDAFFNQTDGKGVINSLTIFDAEDNTAYPLYVLFHQTSTSMGTENSAPNISDANAAAGILGCVAVAATDWLDIGGSKVACIRNIGLPVSAVSGTDDLYVSVVNGSGTPTYAGGALKMIIGALLD